MDPDTFGVSLLAAATLCGTIILLGAVFLLILRVQKYQYSLRFLVLSVTMIGVILGLWVALLRPSYEWERDAPVRENETNQSEIENTPTRVEKAEQADQAEPVDDDPVSDREP